MYTFNVYWTDKMKIDFLQRVVLIHSYLYYEKDTTLWSDKKYDEVVKQLTLIQKQKTEQWIKHNTQYGYCFYDFDGTTGFDLCSRLKEEDRPLIKAIVEHIIGGKQNED